MSFRRALSLNIQLGTSVALGCQGNALFAFSPLSKQHLALTMATAMYLYQSAEAAQSIKIQQKMSRSQHFSGFSPALGGAFSVSRAWASAATQWGKRTSVNNAVPKELNSMMPYVQGD